MKYLKRFEDLDTNPNLIVQDQGNVFKLNKIDLEGKMYRFFKENHEIIPGDNPNEIWITYEYETWGGNNVEDITNAQKYLETLPGVETVIHRMGHRFEITFDKPIEM